MKPIASALPSWETKLLPPCPFAHEGYYGFNPSIHREPDGRLLCIVRCADYCRPNGISQMKRPGRVHTRNVMLELDPSTLDVVSMREVAERDGLPRAASVTSGFEDVRLFRTERDGLQAIGTTLQLRGGGNAEMVLLNLDENGDIKTAVPLRGTFNGSWSDFPQKNWSPFDGCDVPRFLFSIERAVVFDEKGPRSEPGHRAPVEVTRPMGSITFNGAVETRVEPTFAPADRATGQETPTRQMYDWTPGNLRGGSQLVSLGDGRWLGIAHGVKYATGGMHVIPTYWHVWYVCNDDGKMLAKSEGMKLSDKGIELAMGLAIQPELDRAIVSYGVEDMEARLGTVPLSQVLAMLGQSAYKKPPAFARPISLDAPPASVAVEPQKCAHCGQALPANGKAKATGGLLGELGAAQV